MRTVLVIRQVNFIVAIVHLTIIEVVFNDNRQPPGTLALRTGLNLHHLFIVLKDIELAGFVYHRPRLETSPLDGHFFDDFTLHRILTAILGGIVYLTPLGGVQTKP